MITAIYLYGAWHGQWEFGPWWLAACVFLDVYWISSLHGLATGSNVEPFISISMPDK